MGSGIDEANGSRDRGHVWTNVKEAMRLRMRISDTERDLVRLKAELHDVMHRMGNPGENQLLDANAHSKEIVRGCTQDP